MVPGQVLCRVALLYTVCRGSQILKQQCFLLAKIMKRIIVDLTQLAHWTGKITGIPRVMDELARRFHHGEGLQVTFVSWVKDQREFYEIDYEQTIAQRKGVVYIRSGTSAQVAEPGSTHPLPATSALKKVAKKGLSLTKRVSPRLSQKLEAKAKRVHMQGYDPIIFSGEDILFIPWGEWWDPQFTERVVQAHEEGAKVVQVIHDVAPIVWPQFFEQVESDFAAYNSKVVPIAELVLTVSKNTKKELVAWLKQNKLHVPKIEVFRLGDDLRASKPVRPTDANFVAAKLKDDDYIMCVGTFEAKKNHALFYYVYKLAIQRGIELPKLVIVGRRGWHTQEIHDLMSLDPEVRDKFVFLHNASDEELSWLYDHCLFTVLPSFHEGWGIPIAESLGRGVPCASSNTSSMVEIAEGLVEHFSPASSEECLAAIQKLLKPNELKAARQRVKKYRQYTWDDTFKQVSAQLEDING